MCKEIITQHDDRHIDQVVGNKNRGQRALRSPAQFHNLPVTLSIAVFQLIQVAGSQREKSNFRTGSKTGNHQQDASQHTSSNGSGARGQKHDFTEQLLKIIHLFLMIFLLSVPSVPASPCCPPKSQLHIYAFLAYRHRWNSATFPPRRACRLYVRTALRFQPDVSTSAHCANRCDRAPVCHSTGYIPFPL